VKLLRLLQDREFERLGGNQTLKSTARILAATHQPLEDLIRKRSFREDLFYRLNVLPIWIPALRSRAGDIESLARDFCRQFGAANGRDGIELAPDALALLKKQPWPGNVRELQNFIERLVVLSDGEVLTAADVMRELARRPPIVTTSDATVGERAPAGDGSGAGTLEATRRDAEREAIITALAKSGNNRVQAARLLGISRRGLYHKLGEHGLL
jgi:two-component system response regulator AtoC